jgi:hypothetical protein
MGLSTEEEIVEKLKKQDLSEKIDPTNISQLNQALWALEVVKDKADIKRITAKTICYILSEIKEINIKEKAVIRAFARSGGKIKSYKEGNKTYYEIMQPGRKSLEKAGQIGVTANGITFFTGGQSWTDPNKNFPQIINILKGDLCIVDPYYGEGTFYVLEKFGKKRKIRFLSCFLGSKEQQNIGGFNIGLTRFKKEFKNITLKKYSQGDELHDRYILADNALVIVGHGIKDLASKESFIVYLPRSLVGNFINTLKNLFNQRWAKSNEIK